MMTINIGLLAADMFEMERGYRADPKDLAQWCEDHGCKWMGYSVKDYDFFGEEWSEQEGEIGTWSIPATPIKNNGHDPRGRSATNVVRNLLLEELAGDAWDGRRCHLKIEDVALAAFGIQRISAPNDENEKGWFSRDYEIGWIDGDNTFTIYYDC